VTDPRVAPQAARFGGVADRYERARPLYPEAALSELAAGCGVRWAAGLWDLRQRLTGAAAGTYPGRGWAAVLAADERFGPRTSSQHDVVVTTTVDAELADSASRSCVHVVDEPRRQRVLDHLRRFLDTHPETAGRRQLTYTRPCTLHLCQRSG
jgi:hypothetical protein